MCFYYATRLARRTYQSLGETVMPASLPFQTLLLELCVELREKKIEEKTNSESKKFQEFIGTFRSLDEIRIELPGAAVNELSFEVILKKIISSWDQAKFEGQNTLQVWQNVVSFLIAAIWDRACLRDRLVKALISTLRLGSPPFSIFLVVSSLPCHRCEVEFWKKYLAEKILVEALIPYILAFKAVDSSDLIAELTAEVLKNLLAVKVPADFMKHLAQSYSSTDENCLNRFVQALEKSSEAGGLSQSVKLLLEGAQGVRAFDQTVCAHAVDALAEALAKKINRRVVIEQLGQALLVVDASSIPDIISALTEAWNHGKGMDSSVCNALLASLNLVDEQKIPWRSIQPLVEDILNNGRDISAACDSLVHRLGEEYLLSPGRLLQWVGEVHKVKSDDGVEVSLGYREAIVKFLARAGRESGGDKLLQIVETLTEVAVKHGTKGIATKIVSAFESVREAQKAVLESSPKICEVLSSALTILHHSSDDISRSDRRTIIKAINEIEKQKRGSSTVQIFRPLA